MAINWIKTGKKAAKIYAIGGAVYAGAWLVDRAIRTARGLADFIPPEGALELLKHTADDFLLWPVHAYNVAKNVQTALNVGADALIHIPIVGAIKLPGVVPVLPPRLPAVSGLRGSKIW